MLHDEIALTFFINHHKITDFGVVITKVMEECGNNSNSYSIIFKFFLI